MVTESDGYLMQKCDDIIKDWYGLVKLYAQSIGCSLGVLGFDSEPYG